jgi:acyl carrier protein
MPAMPQAEIYASLTDVMRDVFDDDKIVPTAEMTADDVEDWDSLSHIRLIISVEGAFGIRFSTVELGKLKSVGDLVTLIEAKQAA